MKKFTAAIVLLGVIASAALVVAQDDKKSDPPKKPKGKFTVGKETTYVTGPVGKDGYIDFAAALNERFKHGVTPENNANILIWKTLGPHPEKVTMPPEFFKLMGIDSPPENGDYFVDIHDFAAERLQIAPGPEMEKIYQQSYLATQRPWKAETYPNLAAWLKANEKPLAVLAEATKRTQYFSPLVTKTTDKGSSGLLGALLLAVQKTRGLANVVLARAMLRIEQGAVNDAWRDLQMCHRLGRLVGRGGTLIEALVGIAIDNPASNGDLVFLDRTKPDAKTLANCMGDLRDLPPMGSVADKVDFGERFFLLDTIMMVDRHGMKYLESLSGGAPQEANAIAESVLEGVNWDTALRTANGWYDRLAKAMRDKDPETRRQQLRGLDKELRELRADVTDPGTLSQLVVGEAKDRDKIIGDLLITLLLPAVMKVQDAADRAQQTQANVVVAYALASYHRDQGRYPPDLAPLSPKYVSEVPQDLFSSKPLVYRPSENGYLLYSVGMNGKDDGGRGQEDEPRGDDIVVRVPLPELKVQWSK